MKYDVTCGQALSSGLRLPRSQIKPIDFALSLTPPRPHLNLTRHHHHNASGALPYSTRWATPSFRPQNYTRDAHLTFTTATMTKKKRDRVDIKEILARPWCYYCERDFDDQKVLISHQKAKHFKCDNCNRRLNTAGGLSVHLQQVHKETLTCVANAIEGREKVEPEIFGMMGIPDELLEAHAQRTEAEFKKVEDERRALTGNPPPGQKNGEPNTKKRKIETPEELKARLQEHRAKRAAEKQAEQESKAARSASITPDPAQAHPAHMHQVVSAIHLNICQSRLTLISSPTSRLTLPPLLLMELRQPSSSPPIHPLPSLRQVRHPMLLLSSFPIHPTTRQRLARCLDRLACRLGLRTHQLARLARCGEQRRQARRRELHTRLVARPARCRAQHRLVHRSEFLPRQLVRIARTAFQLRQDSHVARLSTCRASIAMTCNACTLAKYPHPGLRPKHRNLRSEHRSLRPEHRRPSLEHRRPSSEHGSSS